MNINPQVSLVGHECTMQWRYPIVVTTTKYGICHTTLYSSLILLFSILFSLAPSLNLGCVSSF